MNLPDSLLEAQTLALLRRLAREQDARCHRIGDEAAAQAAEIVRKARAEARARVRQSIAETRREQERALTQRRASLDTGARQRQQAALGDWLEHAWQALPAALQARWEQPASRAQWCAAAMRAALRDLLGHDALEVEVDARWLADVAPLVTQNCPEGRAASVVPQPGLGAGLRIRAGHACVDATIAGLLAPRDRIAAELLAEYRRRITPPATEDAP
jgi:vacuolar-type H+-ATPase subunit E/Vma4